MKKILIISFHYPPVKVSSAVQRILKFTKYLPETGWQPILLTIKPFAASQQSNEQINEIPVNMPLYRSFALDTTRHLSIKGKYLSFLALPDQWASWIPFGIIQGLILIKKHKPDVIMSTYPIASAHCIAYLLCKISKISWVADFRDSMTDEIYPPPSIKRKIFQFLEKKFCYACSKAIFTTKGTLEMYRSRYPDIPDSKWAIVPNGFDEENFLHAKSKVGKNKNSKITIVHSGIIYPTERDPRHFFSALSQLKDSKLISPTNLQIILRATGHDKLLTTLIEENNIQDIVFLMPQIAYEDALSEMLDADALLILQADNCNHQIPAKIYEYIRAQKPILALTDPQGDTAKLLKSENIGTIIPLNDTQKIFDGLIKFLSGINKDVNIPTLNQSKKFNRKLRTHDLAGILNHLK